MTKRDDLPISAQRQIIEDFKEDTEAFAEVYNFYYDHIFRYLMKRVMSADIAYDITADAFIKAFKSFHRFKWQGISIKVWLYRIAINTLKSYYKKPKTFLLPENFESHPDLITECKNEIKKLDKTLFGDKKLKEMHQAIQTLNPKYQNIISLYYFSGMSQIEIGQVIGRSPSAVKSMMHRAITQLRNKLKTTQNK